jgi:hypothetical protein
MFKSNKVFDMKKIFLFYSIFILFMFLNINPATASCPEGYSQGNFAFTYNQYEPPYTSCSVTVTYCYFCSMLGVGFDVKIEQIKFGNINCLTAAYNSDNIPNNPHSFSKQLESNLMKDLLNNTNCIKPCDWLGWQQFDNVISSLSCSKVINDVNLAVLILVPCESSARCNKLYRVCVNIGESGLELHKELVSTYITGSEDCPYTSGLPPLPPFGYDPWEYWESECFVWPNDCQ